MLTKEKSERPEQNKNADDKCAIEKGKVVRVTCPTEPRSEQSVAYLLPQFRHTSESIQIVQGWLVGDT